MSIAVAYEGSEWSNKALKYAIREAKQKNASVLLVYALAADRVIKDSHPIVRSLSFGELAEHYKQAISDSVQSVLEQAEKKLEEAGLQWEARVLNIGDAVGPDIVKLLREEGEVDTLVIGLKKTSPTGKFFLGSTAQHLILNAPCPVLSVNRDVP